MSSQNRMSSGRRWPTVPPRPDECQGPHPIAVGQPGDKARWSSAPVAPHRMRRVPYLPRRPVPVDPPCGVWFPAKNPGFECRPCSALLITASIIFSGVLRPVDAAVVPVHLPDRRRSLTESLRVRTGAPDRRGPQRGRCAPPAILVDLGASDVSSLVDLRVNNFSAAVMPRS